MSGLSEFGSLDDAAEYVQNTALGERVRRRWARSRHGVIHYERGERRRAAKALVHDVPLLGWQHEVNTDPSRFRVTVAGRRSGKTFLLCLELLMAAASMPNAICWYVGPTFRAAKDVAWATLKDLIPPRWIAGKPNESELTIRLRRTNSLIALRSAEIGDALRGPGLDFLAADEYAFWKRGGDIWKRILRPMLSVSRGRAIIGTSPAGFNDAWEAYEKGRHAPDNERARRGWKSWQVTAAEAGLIHPDELQEAREELDEASYAQEYDARFANLTGLVYRAFQRERHHDRTLLLLHDRDLLCGMDFNVDPFTFVLAQRVVNATTYREECHILKAVTLKDCDTARAIAWIKQWCATKGFARKVVVCPDATGKARKTSAPSTDHDLLRAAGFDVVVPTANPLVRDRVNAVNSLLRSADDLSRVRVHPVDAADLVTALEGLTWVNNEPDPKSRLIHITDAFGYLVWSQFNVLAARRARIGRYRIGG